MTKYVFQNAKFIKTALQPQDYPELRMPSGKLMDEVAVAGRSNVGKSSLLNHLFHTKGLVKTSSTPGKTQALNFFTVNESLAFADLPGYGYAKVPVPVRRKWGPMVQRYLEARDTLKVILFLFDIRRMPNDEDRELIEWIIHNDKAMILVLTKTDKLGQNAKRQSTQKILEAFNVENLHYIHYSVTKNVGRKPLISMLTEALQDEQEVD